MKKDIENKFFKAFKRGGIVDACIEVIAEKYDLGYSPKMTPKEEQERLKKLLPEERKIQIQTEKKWKHFYDTTLPERISTETSTFDDSVIKYFDSSPLIDEIENNINECQVETQRERYLFSLLTPFKIFSDIFHPTATISSLEKEISKYQQDKLMWESMPKEKHLFNVNGKPAGTPQEQAIACESFIKQYKEKIERIYYINKRFIDLTCKYDENTEWRKTGTVEACLSFFVGIEVMFANHLDAMLLTHGIDLMKLQQESGIYLKSHRLKTDIDLYIGSMELTQKYIDALRVADPQTEIGASFTVKQNKNLNVDRKKNQVCFEDCILHSDKKALVERLHEMIKGKKGKSVALILTAAEKKGYVLNPTFSQVTAEFGYIGARSGFDKYFRNEVYKDEYDSITILN